jgi:hypothetical protein
VSANVGPSQPLPLTLADGGPSSIELAFDQLLLPSSLIRQSLILTDLDGNAITPDVAYDPVARVVSLTPNVVHLMAGQTYTLTIVTPQTATDVNPPLQSVGGTTLSPSSPASITFVAMTGTQSTPPVPHTVDFCNDVLPIFTTSCGTSSCHTGALPAEGLALSTPSAIFATAIGRTAEGSNTGPVASPPQTPGSIFGIDMPIVDPGTGAPAGGDPSNSWLLYKLLLAMPSACPTEGDAGDCDAGAPPTAPPTYNVAWQPLSDDARTTLAELVQGYWMPYPPGAPLSIPQLETVSFWIAEGAPVPSCP